MTYFRVGIQVHSHVLQPDVTLCLWKCTLLLNGNLRWQFDGDSNAHTQNPIARYYRSA